MAASDVVGDAVALGQEHRDDPVAGRTGGPAGNARLTAWLGLLLLLVLFVAELVTLLDVSGLVTWHIAIGVLLVPPTLAKTATTGWRMVRYYTRSGPYVQAGPPPLLLRLLGPLVVLGGLAVLGTGLLLVAVGPSRSFSPWFSVLGHGVGPLTLHQGAFAVWLGATGLHVLVRLVPAAHLALGTGSPGRRVPAPAARAAVLLVVLAVGVMSAVLVVDASSAWSHAQWDRFGDNSQSSGDDR